MRASPVVWGLLLGWSCAVVLAEDGGENLVKNGDFSKGRTGWDMEPGVRVVEEIEDGTVTNKVIEIELHKTRPLSLSTRIQPKSKAKSLVMTARAKPSPDFVSATPEAGQITFRLERPDKGAVSCEMKLKLSPEWQNLSLNWRDIRGGAPLKFVIMAHPGSGRLFLDDVVGKGE